MDYLSPKYALTDFHYFRKLRYVNECVPQCKVYAAVKIYPDGKIEKLPSKGKECEVRQNVVYIGNVSSTHFGLWLVDYISCLWKPYDGANIRWIYTSLRDIKQYAYITELLELTGVKMDRLERVTEETLFRNVIVPQPSFIHGESVSSAFASLYARMRGTLPPSQCKTYEKIYLTRTKLNRKKEIGEWRFEYFFEANGYKPISLEKLSLAEQATILKNAKCIASLEGTHAHSIVWREVQSGGGQIILRKQSEVIPRQMMLNQLWELPLTFIDVFEEPYKGFPISHDRGPFLLRWTPQIEQFAKDNNMVVPEKCKKGYLWDICIYTIKCALYRIKHTIKQLLQ